MPKRKPAPPPALVVRPVAKGDFTAIHSIYAHHVLHGLASFEEVAPDAAELRRRADEVLARGQPYVVAELEGSVVGYGYCSPYRARSAYRHVLEDSVYVRDGMQGRGIGRAVLAVLIERCEVLGYRQLIAVIGDSANTGSIGLHAALGFIRVGTLRSVGWKFGRWIDSVYMQRPLGTGDGTPPVEKTEAPRAK